MDYDKPAPSAEPDEEYPLQPDPDSSLAEQPDYRMGNAHKLLELVHAADRSDSRTRFLDSCAEVDDMYDRRPPDDDGALEMDGLSWTNNVDWGGMEFGVDSAVKPEFNLMHQAETYIKIQTDYEGSDLAKQKRIVEEQDKKMLDNWEDWVPESGKMLLQRKKYGLGIFYFREPRSPEFSALHPGNLVTTSPGMNPKKWSWAAVHTEHDISDLLMKLSESPEEDAEGFAADGWNRKGIRRAIEAHTKNKGFEISTNAIDDADNWRNQYLTEDLWWSFKNDMCIAGYIVYVREHNGKITEYMLTKKQGIGFLFRSPEKQRITQMTDAFAMFPEHPAQNLFRETRGYGVKNIPFFDAENRLTNHALDSNHLSSTLFLSGGSAADIFDQQDMVISAITMLPSNLQISNSQMPDTARNGIPMLEYLTSLRRNSSGATGGVDSGVGPDRETAKGATIRLQQGQVLEAADANFFYSRLQIFHRVRFSRYMSDDFLEIDSGYKHAKKYVEKMAAKGVTGDFIQAIDFDETMVCRVFGNGNPAKAYADLMDLKEFAPYMTASGRQSFFKQAAHAKVGRDLAVSFFGTESIDITEEQNIAQAQLENGHLQKSDARLDAGISDAHYIHVPQHLDFLEATAKSLEDGAAKPEDVFQTISRGMAHIGFNEDGQPVGGHIGELLQDPASQQEAQNAVQRMAGLINLRRQIGQQLEAKQQSDQQEQIANLKQPLEEQAKAQKIAAETMAAQRKSEIEINSLKAKAEYEEKKQQRELEKLDIEINILRQKQFEDAA